jgi:two-component system response regulator ChvI
LESDKEFEVEAFSAADDAISNFETHPPNYYDLVITDIRMPNMNGFELYRHIKEADPSVRIAFITAFEINKAEFIKVIPSVEVIDFISKPVSIANLKEKIRSMLPDYFVNAPTM